MTLLFDHNLSPRLVGRLADVFPEALHVADVRLDRASDEAVWAFARRRSAVLVTQDSDFNDLAALQGPPPHVAWIRRGNSTTAEIEALLRHHADALRSLPGSELRVLILR